MRVVSFGFKYGPPADADLVLDVRMLENPYFVPELGASRAPTPACATTCMDACPRPRSSSRRPSASSNTSCPKYEREGKSYLTIAFGCTGGMHRSVVLAEHVAGLLDSNPAQKERSLPGRPAPTPSPRRRSRIAVVHRDVAAASRPRTRTLGEGTGSIMPPSTGAE